MNTSRSETPASSSAAVVGPQFVLPFPVDLFFTDKAPGMKKAGNFVALDNEGKLLFQVHPKHRRFMSDAAGVPLICMKDKFRSFHDRREVFRGDGKEKEDLLFSVKESSPLQFHYEKREVFLVNNTNEDVCDYKITGRYHKRTVTIYKGESSFVVAQMSKAKDKDLQLGKHGFRVSVSPNTDFAFIASLICLLHQMERERAAAAHAAGSDGGTSDLAVGDVTS